QKEQRENETAGNPEGKIENAANQERDTDCNLHLSPSFTCPPACEHRPDSRTDSPRREQNTNSGCGLTSDGKNPLAKDREKRQNSATHAPGGFDQQVSQHPRAVLNVTRAFDRIDDAKGLSDVQARLRARRPFRKSHSPDEHRRSNEG